MRNAGFAALMLVVGLSSPALGQRGQPAKGSADSRRVVVMAIEEGRTPTAEDLRVLLEIARTGTGQLRNAAIRALGRLERRLIITDLLPLLAEPATRAEAANALAQALRGELLDGVTPGEQVQAVLEALVAAGAAEMQSKAPGALAAVARSVGRLPYTRPDQFRAAEAFLRQVLETPFPFASEPHVGAARGLESLIRINRKLATLEEDTIERLRSTVTNGFEAPAARLNAMAALVSAQGTNAEIVKAALGDEDQEMRRLGVLVLAGSGSSIGDGERVEWIRALLSDPSAMVRYEAVRAWTRRGAANHGCLPLLDALNDSSLHVVLSVLDALGDQCRDDTDVTDRVTAEARTPPTIGRWQREAHAFVALAKRAPDRAAIGMMTFAMHPVWQVRMYAARAAAIVDDVGVLARLAADPEDNVADAALPPLRKRIGADSDAAFVAALKRTNRTVARNAAARPFQIIRTAAKNLEGARSTPELVNALVGALERITAEQCETSRDTRLALLERLAELATIAQARALTPLLEDLDPVVARAAAALIGHWTGKLPEVESPRRRPSGTPTDEALSHKWCAAIELDTGKKFEVSFMTDQAPLARARFLALARTGYYDTLTFHRVVPNFVIQGGSPGANEYCGDCPFMRDEVGLAPHVRGTIGISTRGRDTGDAQIFINLVDNARLDYEYTAFARVSTKQGMAVVDEIQEGDRITRVRIIPPTASCGR